MLPVPQRGYEGVCHSNVEDEVVEPSDGLDNCGASPAKTICGIRNIIRAGKMYKNLKIISPGRSLLILFLIGQEIKY